MTRSFLCAAVLLTAVACSKQPSPNATSDTMRTPLPAAAPAPTPPPAPAAPGWALTVLYKTPNDPAKFEQYYAATHLPIVAAKQAEIGFSHAVYMKFPRNADGKPPAFYRMAQLWFDTEDALKKGLATPGFKAVGDDIPNFATGGVIAMIGQQTQ